MGEQFSEDKADGTQGEDNNEEEIEEKRGHLAEDLADAKEAKVLEHDLEGEEEGKEDKDGKSEGEEGAGDDSEEDNDGKGNGEEDNEDEEEEEDKDHEQKEEIEITADNHLTEGHDENAGDDT